MIKMSAILFISLLMTTNSFARADTDKTDTDRIVQQAVSAWDNGDYAKSLDLFTRAHKIQPDNPAYIWNMARCNETLGNLKTALARYRQVLAMHPPKSKLARLKARIQAVQARLKEQQAVARSKREKTALSIQVPKDAVVIVDGGRIGQGGGIVPVKPGRHTVIVTREGYRSCTRTVEARTGRITRVDCPLIALKSIKKGVWHQPAGLEKKKPVHAPVSVVSPRPEKRPWSVLKKALFWSGISVAAVGMGVNIWAAMAGRDTSGSYTAVMDRRDSAKKGYYSAGALYGVGAALVITALVLPDKKAGQAVTVAPGPDGGAMVGYFIEF